MKNAMKKLTSLLLVAVLLVGAIPFGAMAAEDEISFAGGANEAAAAAPVAEGTPAPVNEDEVVFDKGDAPAANNQAGQPQAQFSLVIEACAGCGVSSGNWNISADIGTRPGQVVRDFLSMSRADWDVLCEKYDVTFVSGSDSISTSTSKVHVRIAEKAPAKVDPVNVTLRFDGTSMAYDRQITPGTVLTLDKNTQNNVLLNYFDATMPVGQRISMFKEVVYNDGAPVGDPVVISDKYTVAKAVEILVITVPADTTNNGGNTTGGTTGSTGTQQTPAGVKTVTFYNFDKSAVLHTAKTDANGKLAAIDVNYAAMLVKAPAGYVFSDRWTKNGTGDSIATSTIINELTFNADTFFVPVFTAEKTNIVTSTKNQNDIFLNIFVNKDFNHCKTVKLNDHWVISDNKITTAEILQYVVTDYYKASNGNLGLQCDGLYYSVGSFMYNWLLDNAAVKTDSIDGIDVKRANGTVTINVMVTNAVAKNGAAADKSNPKTGDSIYTAMTVMGISAASLAAVMYFYNKKRMAL